MTFTFALTFLLAAATTGAPPDLTGIAALITAAIGVVGFMFTAFRGNQNNKRVEEVEQAASYVKGFDALVKRLQGEIEEVRDEQKSDRKQWAAEKEGLLETIRALRAELREAVSTHSVTSAELSSLRGQIRGYLTTAQYQEFEKHVR